MARALKVFSYSNGFHSWTVATTSRARALEAWGMSRDLFKDGLAAKAEPGPDRDAALKAPGEPIKRGLAVDIGKVETAKPTKAGTADRSAARARARVEALETELDQLDAAQAGETEALEARRMALEQEAEALATRQRKTRDGLKAKLKAARVRVS